MICHKPCIDNCDKVHCLGCRECKPEIYTPTCASCGTPYPPLEDGRSGYYCSNAGCPAYDDDLPPPA